VDASDSGKLCGPKAANLGQLKKMFPEKVVEGLVIPFGIFKEHMNQLMPNNDVSYWTFLNVMFAKAERSRNEGVDETEIENYQLQQLEILRNAIKDISLQPQFVEQLEADFKKILGKPLGEIPVFLRSDTNMEDLKDFTGAGLNLTLFNVADKEKILDGIKAVWASPYTERSFKWRQKYLLNPENVFPSILVIPSVDVDYSGVLITKGISNGNEDDLTVAFSRGAGGAVDGQSAETYLIKNNGGTRFLAPAREHYYNSLPESGGMLKKLATFENPILNQQNINDIRVLAQTIRKTLPKETHSDYEGAYDVELGFKDNKLWLFQIRPFVENKKALSSSYLESITPIIDKNKVISLSTKI
jgi:phosphoenolpyruvate synthase/pyruvate phosphate dikinase